MYEAAALVVVAIITVGGSIVTNRQARRTADSTAQTTVKGSIETSRIAAEEQAYERAKTFYVDVIDRQEREIKALETDIERLKGEVSGLEGEITKLTGKLLIANRVMRKLRAGQKPDPADEVQLEDD